MATIPFVVVAKQDDPGDRQQLSKIFHEENIEAHWATSQDEVIELAKHESPDCIIIDDVFCCDSEQPFAKELAASLHDQLPATVFVTVEKVDDHEKPCLAYIDDFLVKPFHPLNVKAKLQISKRIADLKEAFTERNQRLNSFKRQILHEQEVAKKILETISSSGCLDAPEIAHKLSPLALFEGNLLLAARKPTGDLNVLIGEFSGELFPSAVSAMPLTEIFYGMTKKGFEIQQVILEMNKRIRSILPQGIFCAICFVELSMEENAVRTFNGGMPEAYLCDKTGKVKKTIKKNILPLGMIPDNEIADQIQTENFEPQDKLYVFSQNVVNIQNHQDEYLGEQRLLDCLNNHKQNTSLFQSVYDLAAQFSGMPEAIEQMTFAEITLDPSLTPVIQAEDEEPPKEQQAQDWQMSFELRPDSLRSFNPLPLVLHIIMECSGLASHNTTIYTIIAELFSNALEHGVLELDSAMKATPEGFADYYMQREKRLAELKKGYVRFSILHQTDGKKGRLELTIEDSGKGFDYKKYVTKDGVSQAYCGRGLPLLSSLCNRLEYQGNGNIVTVEYCWAND